MVFVTPCVVYCYQKARKMEDQEAIGSVSPVN